MMIEMLGSVTCRFEASPPRDRVKGNRNTVAQLHPGSSDLLGFGGLFLLKGFTSTADSALYPSCLLYWLLVMALECHIIHEPGSAEAAILSPVINDPKCPCLLLLLLFD